MVAMARPRATSALGSLRRLLCALALRLGHLREVCGGALGPPFRAGCLVAFDRRAQVSGGAWEVSHGCRQPTEGEMHGSLAGVAGPGDDEVVGERNQRPVQGVGWRPARSE